MEEDYKVICSSSTNQFGGLQTNVLAMTTKIGERVRELRKARGWSQSELARRVGGGVKPQNIQQLEDGTVKRPRYLLRLAKALDTTVEYLEEGHQGAKPARGLGLGTENVKPVQSSMRTIPLLNYVQAGHPKEVLDDYAPGTGMDEVPLDARTAELLGPHSFALEIEGESMLPDFREGDHIYIDPDVKPRPGDFVVARIERNAEVTFKKYRPRGRDDAGHEIFELVPLNDDYPTIIINGNNPGHVIGVMVSHVRFFRR